VVVATKNIEDFENNLFAGAMKDMEDRQKMGKNFGKLVDTAGRNKFVNWGCRKTMDCSNSCCFDLFHIVVLRKHLHGQKRL